MKKCVQCGRQYPDDTSCCTVDGQPLQPTIPGTITPMQPAVEERQKIIDGEHLNMLSIFHFVIAGFCLFGLAFLFLHALLVGTFVFGLGHVIKPPNSPGVPFNPLPFMMLIYLLLGGILVTVGTLNVLSGIFLRQRRHRLFSLMVGALDCLQLPFGTVLGVFTIVVLSRDSVRQSYSS